MPGIESQSKTVKTLRADAEPVNSISVEVDASQTLVEGQLLGKKNQIHTLTQAASGGTFTLLVEGNETADIAFDASAADVQTALEALPGIEPGDVVCAGGALGTNPVTVQFKGRLAGVAVALTQDGSSLTGGVLTIADTSGAATGRVVKSDPTATDGSETPAAILAEAVTTGVGETARATAYDAGRFNKDAIDVGDHIPALAEGELRKKGVFLVDGAASV